MGMARDFGAAAADQEVEVATLIRLQHVVDVQLTITAQDHLLWRLQIRHARRQFGVRNVQVQATAGGGARR